MATDMPADIRAAQDRWERMWSHREQLLKVARRRSMSQEDAEDAVHEAMLRAAERPDLDDERLGAWLTTVTMRLCVDRYRQVNREAQVRTSPTLIAPGPVPVEEAVCDRAEARWLAVRSGELPARQAEALRLKSEDLDVGQVATRMGLSYRTVESLLARARRTLRNSLAGTLGLALFLAGRARPRPGAGKAQAVAAASTAATLAVAGWFVLPHAVDAGGSPTPPRPTVSLGAQVLRSAGSTGTPAASQTGAPRPSATEGGPRATGSRTGASPLSPAVPSLPSLPSVPSVRSVAPLPTLAAPEVPQVPGVPDVPGVPALPTGPTPPPAPTPSTLPSTPAVPSAQLPAPTPTSLP
ncbi:sigma-70 family RNA polymerase sigma factor [Streptomyces sp. NPDC014006]|uniref:sigma-70 family RNA polymerase sigma factor n=1 Tax=Streptomyces sp. NPDC014006 TaxID=3364870 RepID=UPI0036FE1C00